MGFRCSRVSLVKRTSRMFSPFLAVLGTWVALMGMCRAGNLDRSNLAPLSIVYTVYPYYNSDTLLDIWKAEETLRGSNDVNAPPHRLSEEQEATNPGNIRARDGTSGSNQRESSRNRSDESAATRNDATAEITYWPPIQRGAAPKPRQTRAASPSAPQI